MQPFPIVLALASCLVLAGCAGLRKPHNTTYETFQSDDTHARQYDATDAQACEAARRALLSQGYLVGTARTDFVNGRKNFQPERETHVEIDLRVVCAREGDQGETAVVFVSALQDRYTLKKSSSSASLGVGAIGSLSLPFSASDDSMVKVASETIADGSFYERFFALIDRYLERAGPPPVAASAPPALAAPR
ncbi:DUF2242 domain-containing protein [Aquincola sp. MAHUQ-54]|uniref:DUF2242 domain-containing protein n=1 Tax=Aquincola agrisoli TaxID=3119538 RepID=A0AAW9QG92_9BURK